MRWRHKRRPARQDASVQRFQLHGRDGETAGRQSPDACNSPRPIISTGGQRSARIVGPSTAFREKLPAFAFPDRSPDQDARRGPERKCRVGLSRCNSRRPAGDTCRSTADRKLKDGSASSATDDPEDARATPRQVELNPGRTAASPLLRRRDLEYGSSNATAVRHGHISQSIMATA